METHIVEYKQNWSDECLEWVCGYANAFGGILYIGKDDDGNVIGVKNAKKLSEDIPNKIKSSLGIVPSVSLLEENGYLVETRRIGMNRQVFKSTNDFESFMNDSKIKGLYSYAVKEKRKNDKELIADGCDPDEYDSIWNYMDESYYEKIGAAVNKFFGEDKIDMYMKSESRVIREGLCGR